MKKRQCEQVCFFLIMVCACLFLAGCSNEKGIEKQVSQEEMTYTPQNIDTTQIRGGIYKIYAYGSYLYLITNRWASDYDKSGNMEDAIYRIQTETNEIEEISLSDDIGTAQIQSLAADGQGNVYLLLETYDDRSGTAMYALLVVDEKGKRLAKEDITKEYAAGIDTPDKLLANEKGDLVVVSGQMFGLYDSNLKKIGEVIAETGVDAAAVSSDGLFLCGSKDDKGTYVKALDVKRRCFGKRHNMNLSVFEQMDSLMDGGNGWDFYYRNGSGIYGYSLEDDSTQKIMDYLLSDMTCENILCMTVTRTGKIMGVFFDEQGNDRLMCYNKQDVAKKDQKKVIRVGVVSMDVLGGEGTVLSNAVVAFNSENTHYRIEIVDYEGGQSRLNTDIAAGKQPDILYLAEEDMPVDAYMAQGVFEDLTPYYDRDKEIGTEDIQESFYNAARKDGGMYYVSPYFCLQTVVGSKKVLGDREGWSYEDFEQILQQQKKGVCPFLVQNRNELLDTLLTGQINDYIDWNTGMCRFDEEDFCNILRLCKDAEISIPSEDDEGISSGLREGRILFLSGVYSVTDEVLDRELFQEDISVVGYPCEDQKGTYYIPGLRLALCANSKEKAGAWEFLRTFMTKQYQGKQMENEIYVPTREDCYQMWKKRLTSTTVYVDELGQEIQPYTLNGENVNLTGISMDDMNAFDEVIQKTTKIYHCDTSIRKIIAEEVATYFNGQKTLEETSKIIQNRVSTYVNEIK